MAREDYPTRLEDLAQDRGGPLVCHGCAHSCGDGKFPNAPSGERPCIFCIRNVQRDKWVADLPPETRGALEAGLWTAYYDNSPMKKCPMDCYISLDRVTNDAPEGSVVIT